MHRSARWARRARRRFEQLRDDPASAPDVIVTNPGQAQFGIIQGGTDRALRTESVQATVGIGFEAYAIGGLSVGEPAEVMYDVVAHTAAQLPDAAPGIRRCDGAEHGRAGLRCRPCRLLSRAAGVAARR